MGDLRATWPAVASHSRVLRAMRRTRHDFTWSPIVRNAEAAQEVAVALVLYGLYELARGLVVGGTDADQALNDAIQ
jgi:hypothetical protein